MRLQVQSAMDLSSDFAECSQLTQLWRDQELCDVVIHGGDDCTIPAHKVVLAAASPYFRALFTGDRARHGGKLWAGGGRLAGGRLERAGPGLSVRRHLRPSTMRSWWCVLRAPFHRLAALSLYAPCRDAV